LTLSSFERYLSIGALVCLSAVCWWFLVESETSMQTMSGAGFAGEMMLLMMRPDNGLTYLFAALFMWITMMVAMMVPAVVPMASIYRGMCKGKAVEMLTLVFALSYLVAWSLFAIVAAVLQQWLHLGGRCATECGVIRPCWLVAAHTDERGLSLPMPKSFNVYYESLARGLFGSI
jgi:predicted metal-binding membrane protein